MTYIRKEVGKIEDKAYDSKDKIGYKLVILNELHGPTKYNFYINKCFLQEYIAFKGTKLILPMVSKHRTFIFFNSSMLIKIWMKTSENSLTK